jgi:hypothetical protein
VKLNAAQRRGTGKVLCGSLHITQPKFKCGRHSELRHPEKLLFSGKTNLEKRKEKILTCCVPICMDFISFPRSILPFILNG